MKTRYLEILRKKRRIQQLEMELDELSSSASLPTSEETQEDEG